MNMMMLLADACTSKCPKHAIIAVIGALVVGFVVGRLSKRGKGAACKCGEAKRRSSERKPVVNPEPARQPIPAGSVEIYVGNLSYDMTEEELRKTFEAFGTVSSARVVTTRFNNKSKGFGFVVMPNRPEAEKAIAAMSEKEVMGRKMRVNEAQNTLKADA